MNLPVLGDFAGVLQYTTGMVPLGIFGLIAAAIPSIIGGVKSLFGGGGDGGGGGGGSFGQSLLGAAPGLIGSLAGLFQGGGGVEDLPPQLRDIMNLQVGAGQQAQDLRGDSLTDIRNLRDMEAHNARQVGAFDPTSLGPQFSFLGPTVDQFSGVNRDAASLRNSIGPTMQLIQLAQQAMGGGGTALGASGQINQASLAAGQGAGTGMSDFLATALGQRLLQQQQLPQVAPAPGGPTQAPFIDPVEAEFPTFGAPAGGPPITGGPTSALNPFISLLQQGQL
jgi:hypothetical protein